MLDAPILNLIKTSLLCVFVTEVKYGSKEMEVFNVLYMVNLVLLLMCRKIPEPPKRSEYVSNPLPCFIGHFVQSI